MFLTLIFTTAETSVTGIQTQFLMGRACPTGRISMWSCVSLLCVFYAFFMVLMTSLLPEMVQTTNNWSVAVAESAGGESALVL